MNQFLAMQSPINSMEAMSIIILSRHTQLRFVYTLYKQDCSGFFTNAIITILFILEESKRKYKKYFCHALQHIT